MKRIFLIAFVFAVNIAFSQSNVSFKLIGFGINPLNDLNKPLYKANFIDSNGILTFEPGIQVAGEIFGSETTSVKVIQCYMKDQVGYNSGFSQVLVNFKVVNEKKYYLQFGIGPIIHYRKTWALVTDYQDEGIFDSYGINQFNVTWLSAEAEFNWKRNKYTDFAISLNHIHPRSLGIFFGMKFWISRKSQHCNTCPSYK
ncbi:MAG: hypothetical protein JXL97_16500 [Bacteroidales bacterium]|nr:hypothetical protein [Bacteroidales bacterium]